MSKKITLGVIGFVGIGFLLLSPSAKAATVPEADQATRALLGQALNVLQVVLNQIDARTNSAAAPINNQEAVKTDLGDVKSTLLAINANLQRGASLAANPGTQATPAESANIPANANPANVPQTATLSWFVGPKLLFILLPVAILALVAAALFRKRKPEEKTAEATAEVQPV